LDDVSVRERSWSGAPLPCTLPTSQPAGKFGVAFAVLPWKKPPVSGMGCASTQPLANGTSVGGTASRTNAVSCTSCAVKLVGTTRYAPAGTLRLPMRTGVWPEAMHASAVVAVHAGVARPTAPVSPMAKRSTSSTSEFDARSSS
jgi:hypothetical protein